MNGIDRQRLKALALPSLPCFSGKSLVLLRSVRWRFSLLSGELDVLGLSVSDSLSS